MPPTLTKIEVRPTGIGTYELWQNDQRVATGTEQSITAQANEQRNLIPNTTARYTKSGGLNPNFARPVSVLSSAEGQRQAEEIKETISPPKLPETETGKKKAEAAPSAPATSTTEEEMLKREMEQTETPEQKVEREWKERAEKQKADFKTMFDPIRETMTEAKAAQLDQIEREYALLIAKQEEINRRSAKTSETLQIRGGTARFAPEIAMGAVNAVLAEGQDKITELYSRKSAARAKIESAYAENKATIALKEFEAYKDIDRDMNNAIDDLHKEMREANKKVGEKERLGKIEDVVSDSVMLGVLDKNALYRTLRLSGLTVTTKEVDDAVNNIIPKSVASSDISADERIFRQMKEEGVLPPEATMFDFWKKKDEVMRDPKSTDPLLQIIRELTVQSKLNEMNGYITFTPKDQREFDYADGFRMAVSDAPLGQAKQRGQTFSNFMERGEYKSAREYIFKTALETAGVDDYRQIGGAANTLQAFNQFDTLKTEMQEAGIPTNIISGTAENVMRKLGQSTNPNYVYFKGRVSNTLQQYRRAMTGVAFSPAESLEYKKQFPNYKNDISVNRKVNEAMKDSLQLQVDGFYTRKLGSGAYNKLASEGVGEAFATSGNIPQMVNILGQDIEVGSVVKDKKTGVQSRVEADGTITPIQ